MPWPRSATRLISIPAPIDQATLARFITEGFFLSHIKRMRTIYAQRRDFFVEQFNALCGIGSLCKSRTLD